MDRIIFTSVILFIAAINATGATYTAIGIASTKEQAIDAALTHAVQQHHTLIIHQTCLKNNQLTTETHKHQKGVVQEFQILKTQHDSKTKQYTVTVKASVASHYPNLKPIPITKPTKQNGDIAALKKSIKHQKSAKASLRRLYKPSQYQHLIHYYDFEVIEAEITDHSIDAIAGYFTVLLTLNDLAFDSLITMVKHLPTGNVQVEWLTKHQMKAFGYTEQPLSINKEIADGIFDYQPVNYYLGIGSQQTGFHYKSFGLHENAIVLDGSYRKDHLTHPQIHATYVLNYSTVHFGLIFQQAVLLIPFTCPSNAIRDLEDLSSLEIELGVAKYPSRYLTAHPSNAIAYSFENYEEEQSVFNLVGLVYLLICGVLGWQAPI